MVAFGEKRVPIPFEREFLRSVRAETRPGTCADDVVMDGAPAEREKKYIRE